MARVFLFLLALCFTPTGELLASEIHFFAGAGLREPVDQLIEDFQQQSGHRVVVDYGGSGRLLAKIIASGRGDIFLPGSFFYVERLKQLGMVHSFRPVVAHTPVVAVNRAKAQLVAQFQDLAKPGVRVALGDPKAMALGKTTLKILERCGKLQERILANVVVYGATVKQLALYVAEGYVDASIVGRADALQFRDQLTLVPIPESCFEWETVAAAVLTTATDPEAAAALRDFLASPDAVEVFRSFGFLPLE